MKATDLRIGNLVQDEDGVIIEINLKHFARIESKELSLDDIYGIPLTEEWLLKFGFENREFTFDKTPFFLTKRTAKKEYLYQAHTDRFQVKYVHQLQNLYFAVREDELIINKIGL